MPETSKKLSGHVSLDLSKYLSSCYTFWTAVKKKLCVDLEIMLEINPYLFCFRCQIFFFSEISPVL